MTPFIIYEGPDEVLVTTPEAEAEMLRTYFAADSGRDLEDYDRREVTAEAVQIEIAGMRTSW